jgi:hypothetical protein
MISVYLIKTGGVCYPIMLHHLFQRVGFGWGVRIDGFVSGVGCVVATMLTTSAPQLQKSGAYFTVKAVSDIRFVLLTAGSCLVAIGMHSLFFFVQILDDSDLYLPDAD